MHTLKGGTWSYTLHSWDGCPTQKQPVIVTEMGKVECTEYLKSVAMQ